MEIKPVNSDKVIDTDKLPDVDAHLIEQSKKLHEEFAKFGRQLFLLGEMKPNDEVTPNEGTAIYHIGADGIEKDQFIKEYNRWMYRLDNFLRAFTGNQLGLGRIVPKDNPPTSSL